MRVQLLQLDGKIPNLALMRIAAHHRSLGDEVELRHAGNLGAVERAVLRPPVSAVAAPDRVYASLIFKGSRPLADRLLSLRPDAVLGGTGWDLKGKLSDVGISTLESDYALYPGCSASMGFVFRGCRLDCEFCCVQEKEGRVKPEQTISEIWRGDSWPRNLLLFDNDFGGHSTWRDRAREIIDGRFKVSFFQGINARLMFEELAESLNAMDLRDGDFKTRRFYTAWDNRGDEAVLFRGLNWLVKYGLKPDQIMVYMLIGFWPGETHADRDYRRRRLREFGARPYPMPFVRTPELVGFQRWVVRREDLNVPWADFMGANYRPEKIRTEADFPLFTTISH